jgi:hypothetical protein
MMTAMGSEGDRTGEKGGGVKGGVKGGETTVDNVGDGDKEGGNDISGCVCGLLTCNMMMIRIITEAAVNINTIVPPTADGTVI